MLLEYETRDNPTVFLDSDESQTLQRLDVALLLLGELTKPDISVSASSEWAGFTVISRIDNPKSV